MSTEFNYKRAWDEYVDKQFGKLYTSIATALNGLWREIDGITQKRYGDLGLIGVSDELRAKFDKIPRHILAWASEVVYYYGHLAYDDLTGAQHQGFYWKFQKIAVASLIDREANEELQKARQQMKKVLKQFHDHKEGTEYDNEELPALLKKHLKLAAFKVVQAADVNHKPDVFCITAKHFPTDGGMYIRPEQAPCGTCGRPYSEHTYERVLVIKRTSDDDSAVKACMQTVVDFCKGRSIRLDGFALVE